MDTDRPSSIYSLLSVNSIWSSAQSHLPKNIYNFTIRYINNSLPTVANMTRLSQSPDCSFCLNPESLLHIVAGCQHYLDRFTWRHDSILNCIANSLQPVINDRSSLYADVNNMCSLGVFSNECSTFLEMMNDIGIDKTQQHYIIKKMINLAIRATYFIFCRRNKTWDSPDLIKL